MADATTYPCRVVTPDGICFEDEVVLTIASGTGGDIGALANHAPLVADLRMGSVKLRMHDDSWKQFATLEGFIQVQDSKAIVLVEDAINYTDITVDMAQKIIDDGQAELTRAASKSTDDVFTADEEKATKAKAWGEHLLAIAQSA